MQSEAVTRSDRGMLPEPGRSPVTVVTTWLTTSLIAVGEAKGFHTLADDRARDSFETVTSLVARPSSWLYRSAPNGGDFTRQPAMP